MEENRKYQRYLEKSKYGDEKSLKRKIFSLVKNNEYLLRQYYKATNWSIKAIEQIPNIKDAETILEIGVGTGINLEYVKNYLNPDLKFFATDLEQNKLLPDFIDFKKNDIENELLPFEDESFDIVLSAFVIEHLHKPINLYKEAFRILKPGGYFCLVTEHYTSVFLPDYWNFYSDPTHIRPYTKRSLKTLGEMTGFSAYKTGIVRNLIFLPILPVIPILNRIFSSNFSFIPFEIIGRVVYFIGKK